jgi:outer membrane protein
MFMIKLGFVFGFLGLLLLPFGVVAQSSRKLSLNEAVKLGLDNSKQLKVSGTRIDLAKTKLAQYWNAQVPAVNLVSSYTRLSDNVDAFSVPGPGGTVAFAIPQIVNQFGNRLSVSQVIYAGGRAVNVYRSSEFLEKAAELDFDRDRLEIKQNIIAAYFNLYKLQVTGRVLDENKKVFVSRLADTKSFLKQGLALDVDVLKVELALTTLETNRQEVLNGLAVGNYGLALMLGVNEQTVFELEDDTQLFLGKSVEGLQGYLNGAVAARPDLLAIEQRKLAGERGVEVAKGALYPVVSVGGNAVLNNPNQRVFPQEANFKATWDLGVTVSYNLSNLYTAKYQVQEAQINVSQAGLLKEQATEGVKMEVAAAYYGYLTAIKKVELGEKSVLQATENQRVVKKRYDGQIATVTDLVDADFMLLQSKINVANARADVEVGYYKLLKVCGK